MSDITETTPPTEIPSVATPQVQEPTNIWKRGFFVLLIVSASVGLVGLGVFSQQFLQPSSSSMSSKILSAEKDGNAVVTDEEASVAAVVEKVAPSVVSIITSSEVRSFYGTTSQEGAGTGIIVSEDGYVMTNNHVIEGAGEVSVVDSAGTLYEDVTVIGRDPLNDVAFIKINSDTTFTAAVIGDSSTVRVGQQVIAIGNALGQYSNTVTSGILSGTNRPVTAESSSGETESLTDLLQTDASINSGNSGGPLLNLAGQVIGINTAVATDANGIGFAIPINATKGVLAGVLENGTIKRAFMGVNYLDITPEVAREYDLAVTKGAYVYLESGRNAVQSGSPAANAGIKTGDIITELGGYTVGSQGGLSSIIGQFRPDETVEVKVLRNGESLTLTLTFSNYAS